MEDILQQKRDKLYKILSNLGEDIAITMMSDLRWFEIRGYTQEEAQKEVLNKHRQIILNDDNITNHIVGYKDAYIDFDEDEEFDSEKYYECFINSLSHVFATTCDFSVENGKLVDSKGVVKKIVNTLIANEIVQSITEEFAYKESQLRKYETLINMPETKGERLGREISQYGFLDLPKVKKLSNDSKVQLIEMIATKKIPYAIAMFDHLGFLKFLEDKYLQTKDKLHKEISTWFDSDRDGRTIKGNIASLSEHSKEDKKRYTAYKYKEKVAKDYATLK